MEPICSDIEKRIEDYFVNNSSSEVSESILWDALKAVLRGKILALTSAYQRDKAKHREDLLKNIEHLEAVHKQTYNSKVYRKLMELRKKLEALEITSIQRKVLSLNQKYWMRTPKSLKLVAWKVKSKQKATQVHVIRNKEGVKQTLTPDILKVFSNYYSTLYSSTNPDLQTIKAFLAKYVPHLCLTEEHAQMLEDPVTPVEIQSVIKSLKTNKSLGPDGFGLEFYKAYATNLIPQLTLTFNQVLTSGTLPPSWNDATIVVLPKKGRDTLEPKAYIPISLLNQDYKLFTALFTARLNKIIGSYIHPDQAGFIPGRDILDNVYKTLEILHHCKVNRVDSTTILSIDIEKAFDSVEYTYILTLLEHMKFGPKFCAALQSIYQHPQASVRINGSLYSHFDISRGTRQGCLLSPLLFALAMEPLAEALRGSNDYAGIQIGQTEHKLSLFADELLLYIQHPETSLQSIETLLATFQKISGLKVNEDNSLKYPLYMCQLDKDSLQAASNYAWVTDNWTYLGVRFPLDF